MDERTSKFVWCVVAVFLHCATSCNTQDTRHRFPTTRRRLPTVIITREHLRQQQRQPSLYGPHGDTAAEFVVSAGLDNGKSSAVRIRRIGGNRRNDANNNGMNDTSVNEVSGSRTVANSGGLNQRRQPIQHPQITHNRQDDLNERKRVAYGVQLYTPANADGHNQRRHPARNPQIMHRRQDVVIDRNRATFHQRFYPSVDVSVNRGSQQYVPPIFVPHYQQHRGGESNLRRPGTEPQGSIEGKPHHDQDLRTHARNNGSELHAEHATAPDKKLHLSPVSVSEEEGRGQLNSEVTKDDHVYKVNGDHQKDDVRKPEVGHKNVVAETPVLRLNRVKPEDVQNHIIRRPSLVLRDQITVNEVSESSDRPRYGPRALYYDREATSGTRRRRQATNLHSLAYVELNRTSTIKTGGQELTEDNERHISNEHNETQKFQVFPSLKSILDEFQSRGQRIGRDYPIRQFNEHKAAQVVKSNSSDNSDSRFDIKTPYYSDEYVSKQSEDSPESDDDVEDVMSFSDFLASPIAEKIRLERQRMFRNYNLSGSELTEDNSNATVGLKSVMRNATVPLLRNIIAARLLHGILNLDSNHSKNATGKDPPPVSDRTISRSSSSDSMSSAEQRQFGIVVSPYDSLESLGSRSTMPVIRILRGKLVPLPDLPQELIPILMGTYRPTYTSETTIDDPKLTESILDNAILSLLQSEDVMGGRPILNRKLRPIVPRFNRKSPSTNYIGSLKASEPVVRTSYSFKQPNDWSLGPRCDRLTEEICLDDSDYPSSAIMSSIYKDKTKFDLMYAEVKARESQVEGLSRQQEQAYSFDHYYGSQGAESNQDPRDYSPNGGFVCPSEVHYGRPHRAKNRKGEWKVVVNVGEYTQTIRMEKCLASGNPCKYVVSHVQSTCAQVYSYHRLLVFNKDSGLHIDLFRVPTGCTCHLRTGQHGYQSKYSEPVPFVYRPSPYEEFGGHVETAPSPQLVSEGSSSSQDKKPASFGSTLWAILGGGQQAGALAQQPQFLDEVQKQIGWTQQLKQFPQLLKQISPNQVLKQLLEIDDDEDHSIRRQRVRPKPSADRGSNAGGFASHQVPVSVPLPPPPPPPRIIARRPVVSAATPDMFGRPSDHHPKVIAISSSSDQPTKIFSLTKDASNAVRISEAGQQMFSSEPTNIFSLTKVGGKAGNAVRIAESSQQQNPSNFHQVKAYKIRPGMYHPSSNGEKLQFSEASLIPVAPQFSSDAGLESGIRPVLRPMKGSDKRIVEDADLIAIEKSEGAEIHAFKVETVTEEHSEDSPDSDSKINFSYHPILEYLNM